MRLTLIGWLAVISFALRASAQTNSPAVRTVSLQECIRLALQHNLDLQIERLGPQIARFNLSGGYGYYDPELKFATRQEYLDEPTKLDPKKPNPDFGYQMTTDAF